jgi:hypothetical protein
MIISKYGKAYDTANGSEQHHEGSTRRVQGNEQAAQQRWDDDGGPVNDVLVFAGELTSKPDWSVLSLRDLNESVRAAHAPARLRTEGARRIGRQRLRALGAHDEKVAGAARAERDRYGNDWERS